MNDLKSFWLTVNRRCQLRCKWCYASGSSYDPTLNMELDVALHLIEIMAELKAEACKILGGEPSLYRHVIPILNKLRAYEIESYIITNGILYSNKEIMQKHFEAGLNHLIISLKGATEESYEKWTGARSLKKVLRAINNLTEYRGGATITIAKNIKNEINLAIQKAFDAGARGINLHFCTPTIIGEEVCDDYVLEPQEAVDVMVRACNFLEKIGANYNVQVSLPFCLFPNGFIEYLIKNNRLSSGCIVMRKSGLIFDINGEVGFCNHLMDYPFGILNKDFTNGQQLQDLYEQQTEFFDMTNRAPSKLCINCDIYQKCCGGCPLKWTCHDPNKVIVGL